MLISSSLQLVPHYRRLVLTAYLPFLHASSYSPLSMTVAAGNRSNSWEARGVAVEIESTNVTPVHADLWETRRQRDQSWRPHAPFTYIKFKSITNPGSDRQGLLRHNGLDDLLGAAVLSRDKVLKKLQSTYHSPPELGRGGYILYRAEATVAISVPLAGDFSAHELRRVKQDGSQISVSALRGGISIRFYSITFDLDSIDSSAAKLLPASATGRVLVPGRGSWHAKKLTMATAAWVQLF
jgi:hypothetical protein